MWENRSPAAMRTIVFYEQFKKWLPCKMPLLTSFLSMKTFSQNVFFKAGK